MRLLVTGGVQRRNALDVDEWHAYRRAVLVLVDTETGDVDIVLEYESPAEACPAVHPSHVFKSGSLSGSSLYLCTQTEVLRLRVSDFARTGYWSHPWFNDVHHVLALEDGSLAVANSGLDQVLRVTTDGSVEELAGLGSIATWERFDPAVDYRRVSTTKPHEVHPNYLFHCQGALWVTRFEQRDALCLDGSCRRIAVDIERPHDGVVSANEVSFTTVDGHVVVHEFGGASSSRRYRLGNLTPDGEYLGWCRGLCYLPNGEAWVGFSRLRPTRFRSNISWVKHGFTRVGTHAMSPTGIRCYSAGFDREVAFINLEDHGVNAVFSILAL